MAASTFTATNNGYTLELVVTPGSQSVTDNTTSLTYTLTLKAGSNYYSLWSTGWEIVIDGKQAVYNSGTQVSIAQYGSKQIATGSATVTHATDGTKTNMPVTFRIWTSTSQSYLPGSITGSGTMTLTTIPRASSFSLSSTDVTLNSAGSVSATITAASTSFSHKIKVALGSYSAEQTVAAGTTSATISLPLNMLNQIPNATYGTATVTLTTYNGSTAIGAASLSVTIRAGTSIVPTISSFTATRVAGQSAFSLYIKGYDKARLQTSAAGVYGSAIQAYSITGGLMGADVTTGVLNEAKTYTWTVTVTDSRGRTAAKSVSVTVVDYSAPTISGAVFERCDSAGNPDDDGTYLYVKGTVSIATVNSLNSYTAKVQYKLSTDTSWTNAGSYTSGSAALFNVLTDNAYDVRIAVTDKLTTSYSLGTLDVGDVIAEYDPDTNTLTFPGQVAITSCVSGGLNGVSGQSGYVRIARIVIGRTWIDSPIEFDVCRRHDPRSCTLSVQFAGGETTDPALNSFVYTGQNIEACIVKADTSTWDIYVPKSESYDEMAVLNVRRNLGWEWEAVTVDMTNGVLSASKPSGAVAASNTNESSSLTVTSGYFSTIDINKVVISGSIVKICFRGLVETAIPNTTAIFTLPCKVHQFACFADLGTEYASASRTFLYCTENSAAIRSGVVSAGKWIHVDMVAMRAD